MPFPFVAAAGAAAWGFRIYKGAKTVKKVTRVSKAVPKSVPKPVPVPVPLPPTVPKPPSGSGNWKKKAKDIIRRGKERAKKDLKENLDDALRDELIASAFEDITGLPLIKSRADLVDFLAEQALGIPFITSPSEAAAWLSGKLRDQVINANAVAVLGSLVSCPIHGLTIVVTGGQSLCVAGHLVAAKGDATSCGAKINQVSSTTALGGRQVARVGDGTDHGGVILTGVITVCFG